MLFIFPLEPDPCDPNPCQHNGKCTDVGGQPSCECTDARYSGDKCQGLFSLRLQMLLPLLHSATLQSNLDYPDLDFPDFDYPAFVSRLNIFIFLPGCPNCRLSRIFA